ncbi:unnamed protein product [Boreogadus saida]
MISCFATANYLNKHVKSLSASGGFLNNPRLHSQIRVAVTGIAQGVLCFLCAIWSLVYALSYSFYFDYYIQITLIMLAMLGSNVNLAGRELGAWENQETSRTLYGRQVGLADFSPAFPTEPHARTTLADEVYQPTRQYRTRMELPPLPPPSVSNGTKPWQPPPRGTPPRASSVSGRRYYASPNKQFVNLRPPHRPAASPNSARTMMVRQLEKLSFSIRNPSRPAETHRD